MHIELLKTHTHAGKSYQAGEHLDLNDSSAKWLIDLKVAKAATSDSTKQPLRKGD